MAVRAATTAAALAASVGPPCRVAEAVEDEEEEDDDEDEDEVGLGLREGIVLESVWGEIQLLANQACFEKGIWQSGVETWKRE